MMIVSKNLFQTNLQSLLSSKVILVLHETAPLVRLTMPCIPASGTGAELAGFENNNLLLGPCLYAMLRYCRSRQLLY